MTTIKAWHFVGDRLRDGRPIPADGEWLVHEGPIEICASGLHASRRPWHALQYSPGAVLCYVECRGEVVEQLDKLACRERRILVRADVTETLRYFARMQALSVADLWNECPPDVVLDYLMTGDESIRTEAWAEAWGAARDAAWIAARYATMAAARYAAMYAARDAEMYAARGAARDAARDVAMYAAMYAAGQEFDELVCEQFGVEA